MAVAVEAAPLSLDMSSRRVPMTSGELSAAELGVTVAVAQLVSVA